MCFALPQFRPFDPDINKIRHFAIIKTNGYLMIFFIEDTKEGETSMQVQNNIASINAARNQGIETGKLKKSLEKLSSGFRIVRAGDDAAGLAISEGMRSRINSLNQAMKNIDDGIGLTNVGDGALTEVHSMLQRLKTLALKSANGTYDQSNRETLNMEKDQILEEIDRIGSTTKFGEISLFSRQMPIQIQIHSSGSRQSWTIRFRSRSAVLLRMEKFWM